MSASRFGLIIQVDSLDRYLHPYHQIGIPYISYKCCKVGDAGCWILNQVHDYILGCFYIEFFILSSEHYLSRKMDCIQLGFF